MHTYPQYIIHLLCTHFLMSYMIKYNELNMEILIGECLDLVNVQRHVNWEVTVVYGYSSLVYCAPVPSRSYNVGYEFNIRIT